MRMNDGTAAVSMQQFSYKPKDTLPAAKKYMGFLLATEVNLLMLMKLTLLRLYYFDIHDVDIHSSGLREVSVTLKVRMKSRS